MDHEAWTIRPSIGCGPFQFGTSTKELQKITGPFSKADRSDNEDLVCWFSDGFIISAEFYGNQLVCIEIDIIALPSLFYKDLYLLKIPTLEAVAFLEELNRGMRQAQGGSLYFENIGLALLQFETSGARSCMMWSPEYDHQEALADVTLEIVTQYYNEQRQDEWPKTDLLGEAQKPLISDRAHNAQL